MNDLKLEHYVGAKDKVSLAEGILQREGVRWDECVMIGDDLPDVPLMRRVGWPIAVADAQPEVRAVAKSVTRERGGFGAVREAVEMLLRHNGVWTKVLQKYEAS
jgi:3-deoxy-D-manno-octulosonate 8-phosphate phosphatase (KDO 8-P phosphatase)